jgi:hypothetical protein
MMHPACLIPRRQAAAAEGAVQPVGGGGPSALSGNPQEAAPPKRSGNIRPMGDAVESRVHDDSLKAGAGRERLPLDARGTFEERLPLPRL